MRTLQHSYETLKVVDDEMERLLNQSYSAVKAMLHRNRGLLRRAHQKPHGCQRPDAERRAGQSHRGPARLQRGSGQAQSGALGIPVRQDR